MVPCQKQKTRSFRAGYCGAGKKDVAENYIYVTTQKTNDRLPIDLNPYSKAILEKYKDLETVGDHALPVISNQWIILQIDFGIQINFVKFALPLTIFREFCQRRCKISRALCIIEYST